MQSCQSFTPKRCTLSHQPPLPVFKKLNTGQLEVVEKQYSGKYDGLAVIVENFKAMVDLHSMGYFGKGSLSSNYPSFCRKKSNRAFLLLLYLLCKDQCIILFLETVKTEDIGIISSENEVLEDDSSPVTTRETLNLMLEEAFFLSYALCILNIYRYNKIMTNDELWLEFQNNIPNFIPRYIAYHHFRSKGWVVRPGIKFGGDFTLYKEGPPFYHASFVVQIVFDLNDVEKEQRFNPFLAHYRAIEVVKKDLLICQIIAPKNFKKECPSELENFKVSEYLFKRWTPSENRE